MKPIWPRRDGGATSAENVYYFVLLISIGKS